MPLFCLYTDSNSVSSTTNPGPNALIFYLFNLNIMFKSHKHTVHNIMVSKSTPNHPFKNWDQA